MAWIYMGLIVLFVVILIVVAATADKDDELDA
jgi:hypothetical protein